MNCKHCGLPIETDATWLNFWRHIKTGLYQCGIGAIGKGQYAEPALHNLTLSTQPKGLHKWN